MQRDWRYVVEELPPGRVRGGVLRLSLVAVATALGCAAPTEVPARRDASTPVSVSVVPSALQTDFEYCQLNGDGANEGSPCGLDGAVNIRFVYCSAKLSCEDRFLHDPLTFERAPTLVTGFSCGFDEAIPQDALLAYHPMVRCYTADDIGDRSTWLPPEGVPVTPLDGEHIFFSSEAARKGDVYTNSALLMRPLKEAAVGPGAHKFCELDAWGTIAFAPMNDGARRPEHVTRSPAVHWRATLEWTGDDWDCHLGDPELSSVERVVLASATHDQPLPLERVSLPATHAVILLGEEALTGVPGIVTANPQLAVKLRFNQTSWFPVEPDDVPEPMTERQLWIMTPSLPSVPVDLRIEKTCAELGPNGVEAIGVRVSDADHIALGAIIVWPQSLPRTERWDCEREPSGACRLYDDAEWDDIVPCLLPGAP